MWCAQMYEYLYVMEITDPGQALGVELPADGAKKHNKGRGRGVGSKGVLRVGFVAKGTTCYLLISRWYTFKAEWFYIQVIEQNL